MGGKRTLCAAAGAAVTAGALFVAAPTWAASGDAGAHGIYTVTDSRGADGTSAPLVPVPSTSGSGHSTPGMTVALGAAPTVNAVVSSATSFTG